MADCGSSISITSVGNNGQVSFRCASSAYMGFSDETPPLPHPVRGGADNLAQKIGYRRDHITYLLLRYEATSATLFDCQPKRLQSVVSMSYEVRRRGGSEGRRGASNHGGCCGMLHPKGWPPPLLSLPQLVMTHDGYMEVRIYPQGRPLSAIVRGDDYGPAWVKAGSGTRSTTLWIWTSSPSSRTTGLLRPL